MNGYNFTERVRKVLALARDEAHARNHEYVGTEHILLGLGVATSSRYPHGRSMREFLDKLGVGPERSSLTWRQAS
jgi:ATP-dependent Clp protease ATP-binding subunit ClpA